MERFHTLLRSFGSTHRSHVHLPRADEQELSRIGAWPAKWQWRWTLSIMSLLCPDVGFFRIV